MVRILLAAALLAPPQDAPDDTVDLLRLIDARKDAVQGEWRMTPKGLITPGQPFSRLAIPYVPPEEYDLSVVAERHGETNSLNLGLVAGGVQFLVILDALIEKESVSGLDLVDKKGFYANETTSKGALFVDGKPGAILCSVRKDRISVAVDGRKVIDWKADPGRLSLYPDWKIPRSDCLILGSWSSLVRIEKLELIPVTGRGRRLREDLAPPPDHFPEAEARARILALVGRLDAADFDERRAAQENLWRFPVRWLPLIQETARQKGGAEARFRVEPLALPEPWTKILKDATLREAHETFRRISSVTGADLQKAVQDALGRLEELPPDEIDSLLTGFLDNPGLPLRLFALRGLAAFPSKNALRAADFLKDPSTASAAADALCALGDEAAARRALDLLNSPEPFVVHQATRVLEQFDPQKAAGPIAELLKDRALYPAASRILAKAGDEESLLRLLELPENRLHVLEALGQIGGPKVTAAVRASLEAKPVHPLMRDKILSSLGDPEWAREKLADARKAIPHSSWPLWNVAAAGGTSLRGEVRRLVRDTATPKDLLRHLLLLLGAVGSREDGALILPQLADPELAEAASEALECIGDPAHAKALFEAWKRLHRDIRLGPSPEGTEEGLAEILANPAEYRHRWPAALEMAERRLTPRLGEVLFKGLVEGGPEWLILRTEATRVLAGSLREEDGPSIAKLRAHKDLTAQACGHLLALRAGDGAAAPELVRALAASPTLRYSPHAEGSEALRMMNWAAPAGKAWRDAVEAEWRRRPGWEEGTVWLVLEGSEEATAYARDRLDLFREPLRDAVEAKLARGGDAEALERLFRRAVSGLILTPALESAFAEGAGPALRARVIARARLSPGEPVRLAARLADRRAVTLYRQVLSPYTGYSPETHVAACVRALGRLGAREAAGDLRLLLRSPTPAVRAEAARALGEMGDLASLPALARLADDPSPVSHRPAADIRPVERVWHAAMGALEKLTGEKTPGKTTADRREYWRARRQ